MDEGSSSLWEGALIEGDADGLGSFGGEIFMASIMAVCEALDWRREVRSWWVMGIESCGG